jgi:hypothetical protein
VVSRPCNAALRIVVLHILIFVFFGMKRIDKSSELHGI